MEPVLRYRGHPITDAEVAFIRALLAAHPQASRRALSQKLCAAWGWVQANGSPRDMVCRGLLLALDRAGHIELPPPLWGSGQPPARPHRPAAVEIDRTPIRGCLGELGPLELRPVRRTGEEALCNSLIETHHYLGYTQPVGEHLQYVVYAGPRPVACFVWGSAPRHLGPRDRFLGWSAQVRRRNLRFVVYNSRFLILPWVQVPYLASHLLGHMARMLPAEWTRVYGHPVYFAETFVDPQRFRGSCYRAANWLVLGRTTGRGKDAPSKRCTRPIKLVLGYPLTRRFREQLAEG